MGQQTHRGNTSLSSALWDTLQQPYSCTIHSYPKLLFSDRKYWDWEVWIWLIPPGTHQGLGWRCSCRERRKHTKKCLLLLLNDKFPFLPLPFPAMEIGISAVVPAAFFFLCWSTVRHAAFEGWSQPWERLLLLSHWHLIQSMCLPLGPLQMPTDTLGRLFGLMNMVITHYRNMKQTNN